MSKNHLLNKVHSLLIRAPLMHWPQMHWCIYIFTYSLMSQGMPWPLDIFAHNDQLFYLVLLILTINALSVLWLWLTQQTAPCGLLNLSAILNVCFLYRCSWLLHYAMYRSISLWLGSSQNYIVPHPFAIKVSSIKSTTIINIRTPNVSCFIASSMSMWWL